MENAPGPSAQTQGRQHGAARFKPLRIALFRGFEVDHQQGAVQAGCVQDVVRGNAVLGDDEFEYGVTAAVQLLRLIPQPDGLPLRLVE